LASAIGWALVDRGPGPGSTSDFIGPRWKDESADHFTFAASADFGGRGNVDSIALAARARASGASFLVALGDLGYSGEGGSCRDVGRYIPELVIVAGDLEVGQYQRGNRSGLAQACPYSLSSPYVAGNGTPGYGFEYYFDYPRASPLARFIMISAGLAEGFGYNYSKHSPRVEWIEDAVDDARDHGLPWVIVGVHHQCLTVAARLNCSMGQAVFDELVESKVDLILAGQDTAYERTKQLDQSDECPSINATNPYDASCITPQSSPDRYEKGEGTVVVVQGVGGRPLENVTIDGTNPEIGYFTEVMGQNANTEGRLPGFGSVFYNVTAHSITAETDFCPPGSVAGGWHCLAGRDTVFTDRFAISDAPLPPVLSLLAAPPPDGSFPDTSRSAIAIDVPRADAVNAVLRGVYLRTRWAHWGFG